MLPCDYTSCAFPAFIDNFCLLIEQHIKTISNSPRAGKLDDDHKTDKLSFFLARLACGAGNHINKTHIMEGYFVQHPQIKEIALFNHF
ncbi:hypothetical protein JT31_22755 [Cedecea neteri]|uniref:Uncharacterized protein n=1 Tax=Cedecea neteri TaxID=158822 RepID=A0A089RLN2_9ENTR|nr:hypothetical protein JT31_22755 [Cedecea neteri]